jgi:ribonuclease PH
VAANRLLKSGKVQRTIITNEVAAISVGIVGNTPLLDLKYDEDFKAEVDMNVVCTGDGRFIEVQGTAEREPFSREQMESLLGLAAKGIQSLATIQREAIARANS